MAEHLLWFLEAMQVVMCALCTPEALLIRQSYRGLTPLMALSSNGFKLCVLSLRTAGKHGEGTQPEARQVGMCTAVLVNRSGRKKA